MNIDIAKKILCIGLSSVFCIVGAFARTVTDNKVSGFRPRRIAFGKHAFRFDEHRRFGREGKKQPGTGTDPVAHRSRRQPYAQRGDQLPAVTVTIIVCETGIPRNGICRFTAQAV